MVAGRRVVAKCRVQLLTIPCVGRTLRHIEMQNALLVIRNDSKAMEYTEGNREHCQELRRGSGF